MSMSSDDFCVKTLYLKGRHRDDDDRRYMFVASTDAMDADGDIVEQSWNLERYKENPVVLFGHNSRDLPIGHAEDVMVRDGKLEATVVLASEKANPLAEQVHQSLKEGTLRAVSVGFRPQDVRQEKRGDKTVYVLGNNELFEISVVPIPSNPQALAKIKSMAMTTDADKEVVPPHAPPAVDDDMWDGDAARKEIESWATKSDGELDWPKYAKGFAFVVSENAETLGAYKLPHHRVKNGKLVTSRSGTIAAMGALSGARGGADIPAGDVAGVRAHLARHAKQFDLVPPWERGKESADGGKEKSKMEELEKEKAKVETLNQRCKDLEEERNAYKAKAEALQQKLVEKQLDDMVGRKITPNEKKTLLKLAFVDDELFAEHMKSVDEREDMPHLKQTIAGAQPAAPSLPAYNGRSGDGLEALIQRRAFGG